MVMTYLKRASKEIEEPILQETRKVNERYRLPTEKDLKVYLILQDDGSIYLTDTGQVGMTLFSDHELLHRITSGEIFSVNGDIE